MVATPLSMYYSVCLELQKTGGAGIFLCVPVFQDLLS